MKPRSYRIPKGQHNDRSLPGIYAGDCGSAWRIYLDILVVDYNQGAGPESVTHICFSRKPSDASRGPQHSFNSTTDGFRLNPNGNDRFGFALTAALQVGMAEYVGQLGR